MGCCKVKKSARELTEVPSVDINSRRAESPLEAYIRVSAVLVLVLRAFTSRSTFHATLFIMNKILIQTQSPEEEECRRRRRRLGLVIKEREGSWR